MFKSILLVGFGGFIGSVARFLISRYFQENVLSVFPWGTFVVNIVGSLIIGLVFGLSERGSFLSPEARLFMTVGFCGGFTTFSSLSNDAFMLLKQQEWIRFTLYTSISFSLGLFAVFAGRFIIKSI